MELLGRNSLLLGQPALRWILYELLKPRADPPIRIDRQQKLPAMAALAVDSDSSVLRQISQGVRLNFVFFVLGIVPRHFSAVELGRALQIRQNVRSQQTPSEGNSGENELRPSCEQ